MKTGRILKRAAIVLVVLILALLLAGGLGYFWLRSKLEASLPLLEGDRTLAGLSDTVVVERDAAGVPTLRGTDREDLHRALGFLHAQDRFFQMDLMRRRAAGELAELFGSSALRIDRGVRVHRFRARAQAAFEEAGPRAVEMLTAYSEGVNAGLDALDESPPEYVLLRTTPRPWSPADTSLVVMAMYLDLQGYLWRRESDRGVLYDVLPQALADFLNPLGTEWDAPIDGGVFATPPVPGPEVYDLRARSAPKQEARRGMPVTRPVIGSNGWAVAGSHTIDGASIVANDMHLGLGLPNVWYRVVTMLEGPPEPLRTVGVTLPGVPLLVVGSNGHVAWGFTNSYGDWADLVVLEDDPGDSTRYLTPDGPTPYRNHEERIRVHGEDDVVLEVSETIWGPVIDEDHRGRKRALRWVAHSPRGTNVNSVDLELARTVTDALEAAARAGLPAQNLVAGDRDGRVAWSIAGPIPARAGGGPSRPVSWKEAGSWDRWLEPEDYPRIVDPGVGRIWTANNRIVGPPMLDAIGDGGFALGARALQIRDRLLAGGPVDERAMLSLQLDDRSRLMGRWRELLLEVLDADSVAADPRRAQLRGLVESDWNGHAAVDSAGYRMVRGFRSFLSRAVFDAITSACVEADERFRYSRTTLQSEGPLWKLVQERPPHLLDPDLDGWHEQFLAAVDELLDYYEENFDEELADLTWGKRNTVRVSHPLSLAVPQLSRWLDLPAAELPGDGDVPRAQGPGFGASERLVVAPGREEDGIFHMPGGQSGHPLSPFYSAGHDDWVEGNPSSLLPGETVHRLVLQPATSN